MKSILLAITVIFFSANVYAVKIFENELQPFTTDGCSVIPDLGMTGCCIDHDIAYWMGGEEHLRVKADKELRSCIQKRSNRVLAEAFYRGVQIGGKPDTRKTYRWGYGWTYQRSYRALSSREKEEVERLYPLNYQDTPVTTPIKNLFSVPTETGNYCYDSIIEYLKGYFNTDSVKFDEIKSRIGDYVVQTKVKIVGRSETFRFKFKRHKWNSCIRSHVHEILPDFFYRVNVYK